MPTLLADSSSGSVVLWSLIVIGLLIVGLVLALQLRKWLFVADEPVRAGFSLGDLRRMHKEGRMTDEEFEKAKALIVGEANRPLPPKPESKLRPGRGTDPSSQV